MAEPASAERRKTPRIPRQLPVRFGTETQMRGGTVLDISEGGIRIETTQPFPVNSLIQVFVQFPRNALRLRARVAWVGSGTPVMGLSLTRLEPNLSRQYQSWLAEVKQAAKEGPEAAPAQAGPALSAPEAAGSGESAPAAPQAAPEPRAGSIKRRVETMQGNTYDVLLERVASEWYLTIHRLPRQPGVEIPDLEERFPEYEPAERAMREFLKAH